MKLFSLTNLKYLFISLLFSASLLVLSSVEVFAQSISFSGIDANVFAKIELDSILVESLSNDFDTMLVGTNILELDKVLSVESGNNLIPTSLEIGQNYPNPFEDETNYNISSVEESNIEVSVYNILGEKVASYSNIVPQGINSFIFRGNNLTNGVYFVNVTDGINSKSSKILKVGGRIGSSNEIVFNGNISPFHSQLTKGIPKVTENSFRLIGFSNNHIADTLSNQTLTAGNDYQFELQLKDEHYSQLDALISSANTDAANRGLNLKVLTRKMFFEWFKEFKFFSVLKKEREVLVSNLLQGKLPNGYQFVAQDNSADNLPNTLSFEPFNLPIIENDKYSLYIDWIKNMYLDYGGDETLFTEPYQGEHPSLVEEPFDESVETRITEIEIKGVCLIPGYEERDGLKIELLLTKTNQNSFVNYFGFGFDNSKIEQRLVELLGNNETIWINLKQIIPNWVGDKATSFPVDGDNEVCHGAAREFYYSEQDSRLNASTETTALLLYYDYTLLPTDAVPVFGDYLYRPGEHSSRYIMRDKSSGRDISFSVQSGGNAPYRFWWIDEDMSYEPFGRNPDPNVWIEKIDLWRRSK